nr:hemagglutinin repeat-containing protein [Pseudomonas toyotomiensis]
MDVRSPLFQNIALIVAGVLFLNPIVATAAQLAVDQAAGGNTAVTQAQNGVPMVNIATPNGSGLSHNKFTDYNVGQQGLILNNSAQNLVQTQLGGYVVGNPNLKNGAAGLILNEVTGGNASQLKGYTEVAGRSAAVIVANPHGITCDGCGFINTPRVTLSTGTPVIENGRLQRFDVDGGQIAIEGQGLNAGNVDQFDLITRSAQINAELHANKLNIITGRNEVDASTLAATAKADDGSSKPMLAIDSSALGGMYAGAIRLVGTEQGVGVKLAGDMAASAGDIQIDASGKLSLNRVAASNDLKLAANEIELNADTYAGRNATVIATDKTQVKESLAAGNRLEIGGGELDNQGIVEAGVKADGALVTDSKLVLNSQRVSNRGELIARGSLEADVEVLDNSNGKLLSAGNAKIQAAQLANSQGQILAQKNLELGGGALSNQDGELLAAGELRVDAASLNNQSGILAADSIDVKLTGALNNGQGLIESSQVLTLAAGSAENHDGRLRALASSGRSEFQIGNLFDNDQGLVEIGNAAFALASSSLSNLGGTVRHLGTQGFELELADLGGAGGRFITNGELSLSAADWTNTSELQAERLTLNIGQFTQAATGQLISRQSITATGDNWVNDGVIATDGALDLTLSGNYEGNGALRSLGDLTFKADSAAFGSDAQAKSGGIGRFELSGQLLNQGRLTAAQDMFLKLGSLDNRGTLGGSGLLRIEGDSLRNEQGLIFSGADMTLRTASLTNLLGDIYSLGELDVARDEQGGNLDLLDNRSASIESSGDMTLRAAVLRNRKDVFDWRLAQTYGGISVVCYDCSGDHHNVDYVATERFEARVEADSASSRIHSGANLLLNGGEIANRYSTLSAAGDIDIDADSLENTGATLASVERVRRYNTGRVTDGTDERFRANYINPYNAQPLPKVLPGALGQWNLVSDIQRETPIGVAAPGIIQAGGDVRIQATQPITNESVLAHNAPQAGTEQTLETTVGGASAPLVVQLNPQLPADTAQQAVDPISLPGFSLPQGQNGLFQTNTDPGHRYLIETNPAFADLKQFVSSDYMLGLLGFDNDTAQKRLGDGLYEQRLLEQAIAARTGKRYLDGFTNNDAQFRYLMDNAIASKEALSLSVGVGLSSAQVAALTHDIVWLEEREVNGEKVLVPVLYLAQVGDRLAPSGALIQGQDVALISGGSLNNSGTLRASENLSVTAAGIGNSGLMQASDRLQLLATNSIRNAQGGIINGQDVSLIALTGDISNERTISQQSLEGRGFSQLTSVVDKAAGIEASNDLQLLAGGDIQNIGGSLKAGGDAKLNAGGDVIIASAAEERGSMRKDKRHFWSTSSTTQHGSDVQVGGDLAVTAGQDIAVVASALKAGGDLALSAERDVFVGSAANEQSSEYSYKSSKKRINQENASVRQQASLLEAGGDLSVTAGNDLTLSASKLKAGESVSLEAENDLRMLAEADEDYSYYEKFQKKKGRFGKSSSKHTIQEAQSVRQQGVEVDAGTDLLAIAGRDMTLVASELRAEGEAYLYAGRDLSLLAAENTTSQSSYSQKTKKGLLSSSSKTKSQQTTSSEAQGSLVSADTVELLAQRDLRIHGSDVVSTDGTYLLAGNDVDIRGVTESTYRESFEAKKKSGLMGSGGIGVTLGSSSLKGSQKSSSETTRASTVGSVQGDVDIQAGKQLSLVGSDVVAGRDIALKGQEVVISAAQNQNRSEQRQESKKSGLTLALSGSVGSALNSAYESAQAARESEQGGDSRMAALQGVKAGLSGYQAMQAAEMGGGMTAENAGQFFGISLSLGTQKSSSKQVQEQQVSQGSNVNAGRDLSVDATGSEGGGGDLRVTGSRLQAGRDLSLKAAQDIQLEAAANTQKLTGSNKSGGGSVGVSLGVSDSGAGLSIFANANVGKGSEKGNGTTWSETTVDAGRQVSLDSGRDTSLVGSQVSGESITAKVGRDLELRSLQDSDRFDAKQQNVSAGASFTFGTMTGSGYVSVSQNKLKSRYDSVQEQTGLFAGQGGYQIDVGQHTQLDGAVIGSTAEADKNRLSTGTLGWSDIRNMAEFSSQQQSVSVSSSGSVGDQFLGNMAGGMLSGLSRGDKDSSATRAAVSDGTIEIRDTQNQQQDVASLNRDVEHAHEALSPIFDKEKEQRRLREVQAIAEIGSQVMDVVRTEGQIKASRAGKAELERQGIHEPGAGASPKEREAYQTALVNTKAYKDSMAPYGTGGDYQRVAQAVTAALQGLAGGNIDGAIAGAAAPYVANTIKQVLGDNDTARVMAHAVLGAVVAQAQGNSAGAGAAGAVTGELIAGVIIKQLYGDVKPQDLTEEQKQKVSALSTLASGLAGAVVGGDAANAVAGAESGKNAVENNLLSNKYGVEKLDEKSRALYERLLAAGIGSIDDLQEQFVACGGEGGCERDIRNKYQDQEREAGEKLLSLYRSGELSADEFGLLVTRYAKAMFDGIVEAQRNSDGGGFLGDIYRQSGGDWTPAGVIANPFLSAIRASELIAEWKSQGLSDDKINELALKDAVLGSVLSPGDINGVTKLLDNGASGDDVLRYTMMAVLGAVLGGKSGAKATGPVPNLTERGTLVNLRPNDVAIAQRPVRTLVQDESGRYWLQTSTGKRITPSGSYDFVTMPDGSVRVARPNVNQDFSTHLGLSGGGEVKYAGSIRFGNNDGPSRGAITQWTNNSGHYQPPATLSGNAGLPQGLFNPR